jgi:hypothetical protein
MVHAARLGSPELTGACPVSAALFRKRLNLAAPIA